MSDLRRFAPLALLALVGSMAGCATPRPVLDLAGQGAATVGLAEVALRNYLQIANAQSAARMELVKYEITQEAQLRNRQAFEELLEKKAGATRDESMLELIKGLGIERRKLREAGDAEVSEIEKKYSADVLERAQVPAAKLAAAKKAFAVLSQELSAKEWITLAAGYAKEIEGEVNTLKASVGQNKSGGN